MQGAVPLRQRQQRSATRRPSLSKSQVRAESGSNLDFLQRPSLEKVELWAEKNKRGITAVINGTVVGMVILGASYKLVEVDLEISRGWTW